MESPIFKRSLKTSASPMPKESKGGPIAKLGFELLNGVTKVHIAHLRVQGTGSFAAHSAMGGFYDEVGDLADSLIEQYQGATEEIIDYPTSVELPIMSSAQECLDYLRKVYDMCTTAQSVCKYSEIINTIDEIKSLINSTKYKLLFLQ